MKIIEKYDGTKTYMFPNGELGTPEKVYAQWPAAKSFTYIVETDENGEIMWGFDNLSAICSMNGIDKSLSVDEKIAKVQEICNAKPEVDTTPSAEERIAAALEYQNIASMADAETAATN
nr:MAG TPA: hypothetical protein [Caudoviricetes sp.]